MTASDFSGVRIIEFFGISGIGKTTAARLAVNTLRVKGWEIDSNAELIGEYPSGMRRHLRRTRLILREMPALVRSRKAYLTFLKIKQSNSIDYVKAIYNLLTILAMMARAKRLRRHLLLDEGLTQAVWSLFLFSSVAPEQRSSIDVLKSLKNWPVELVVLTASTATIAERLAGRKSTHSRVQTREGEDIWSRVNDIKNNIDKAISQEAKDQFFAVHEFETDAYSPKELADLIVFAIESGSTLSLPSGT